MTCYPIVRKPKKPGPKPAPKIVDTDTIKPLTPPPPAPMKLAQRYCDCGAPIGPGNHSGMCLPCRNEKPVYLPTPEEIAEECAKIRADWTSHEHYLRRTNSETIE